MAVEIKELIIRAVVDYQPESNTGEASATTETTGNVEQEAIVQACVRQVLKILNRSNKR